jgi:integrase
MGVAGMSPYLEALEDTHSFSFLRTIGARVKRLRTAKRALLFTQVETFWNSLAASASPADIRDGFAVVMAFTFGMRVKELLDLKCEDVEVVTLSDGRTGVRVTFRNVKTRQTVFTSHEPFTCTSAHPLLIAAFRRFDDIVEWHPGGAVFYNTIPSRTGNGLSRDWFAGVMTRAAPGTTPHSCRVGLATELWASGASPAEIMACGRWTSITALMYIVGALEDQARSFDRLGNGNLVYTSAGLQRSVGTTPVVRDDFPQAPVARWARAVTG